MKNFEARGKIKNIRDARNITEKMGAIYKGYYSCTDFIFNIKDDVIRIRVYNINNRDTKKCIFVHKTSEWFDNIKTDKVVREGQFDTIGEAITFMVDNYGAFAEIISYPRDGYEYSINSNNIFIENVHKLGPTIEIESDNKDDLEKLLKLFDVREIFSEPTSEIMRKILKSSN